MQKPFRKDGVIIPKFFSANQVIKNKKKKRSFHKIISVHLKKELF